MIVAIHQPNFFPWLGFFDKIARADRFVLLDDVQFPRTGAGSWGNRVKCLIAAEARWVTAPLDRSGTGSSTLYNQMRLQLGQEWRERIVRTLEQSYRKAPHASEAMQLLQPLIVQPEDLLFQYNLHAIRCIADAVGLDTSKLVLSSSYAVEAAGTDRLIQLTSSAGGSVYLSGGGASGYQDDELFAGAGLMLQYQNFEHPTYSQANNPGEFIPGLSVIDTLMNLGISGTAKLLHGQ